MYVRRWFLTVVVLCCVGTTSSCVDSEWGVLTKFTTESLRNFQPNIWWQCISYSRSLYNFLRATWSKNILIDGLSAILTKHEKKKDCLTHTRRAQLDINWHRNKKVFKIFKYQPVNCAMRNLRKDRRQRRRENIDRRFHTFTAAREERCWGISLKIEAMGWINGMPK